MAQGHKKTPKEYEEELFEKEIDFLPLEPYSGNKIPIIHRCINGHERKIAPSNILSGFGCKDCHIASQTKTHEQYLQELKRKNIKYIPTSKYINATTNIPHMCPNCKNTWNIAPSDILSNRNCPKCSRAGHGIYNKKYFENNPEKAKLPGILYTIVLVDKNSNVKRCVKVGITKGTSNKDVLKRSSGFTNYEPRIQKLCHGTLESVYNLEQRIHAQFAEHRYKSEWSFGGHTELFELDQLPKILKEIPAKV